MAKKKQNAASKGGGSQSMTAPGAEQSLRELTIEDFMSANVVPKESARPSWKVTRYPVSKEEYHRLEKKARKADPQAKSLFADESLTDTDEERALDFTADIPEDGIVAVSRGMAPTELAPPSTNSFEGPDATGWQPPDCTIGVGMNDIVAGVNVDMVGYRRDGSQRFRWAGFKNLFRKVTPAGAMFFDPIIHYDHYEDRWIVVVAARRSSPPGSWIMLGISETSDPGGKFWTWALDFSLDSDQPSDNWGDYPQVGFDTQAIYISTNQFRFGGGFQYAKVRILNKTELYRGGEGTSNQIRWYDLWDLRNPDGGKAFTILPCRHYRGKGANAPAYMVNSLWPGGESLSMWTLTDPIGFWYGRTPKMETVSVKCRKYELPPDAIQRGSNVRIETNDSRLMNAIFQYAGGVQRLWTCHTDRGTWSGENEARSVIQWYEIDVPSQKVVQQNAYGARGKYYFFPAIHTDENRNAYLVFGRSGDDEYASLRRTGRRVSASQNDLESSALVKAGESAYLGNRWGDYFGICRDPADPNRVWALGEYADSGGRWGTRAFSMKY